MPIYKILENVAFDPERIEAVAKAFEDAIRDLRIEDRQSDLSHQIAKAIFEAAQRGERAPDKLKHAALSAVDLGETSRSDRIERSKAITKPHPTVLIAEDDEIFAYAAAKYLESHGY